MESTDSFTKLCFGQEFDEIDFLVCNQRSGTILKLKPGMIESITTFSLFFSDNSSFVFYRLRREEGEGGRAVVRRRRGQCPVVYCTWGSGVASWVTPSMC